MTDFRLTFACGLYDRMLALYTGEVRPAGIDLQYVREDDPRIIFDRMVREQAYDACEMSSSEYVARHCAGHRDLIALPVFPSRVFRHGFILLNRRSGIEKPKDLEGRRVGVQLYTMTAAVYIRGLLQHDYGVDLSSIRWVQGAMDEPGKHGNPDAMPLLRPVQLTANEGGRSLADLLEAGEVDAVTGATLPPALKTNPDIVRLFPDFAEVERDYYQRTGIFPIMHLLVMRRATYESHPEIAKSLYDACCRSKELALQKMRYLGTLRYMLPWLAAELERTEAVFGDDPWPYGIEPNRRTLQAFVGFMEEQGLVAKAPRIEDLFAAV
jgi:4,5-dihydroxyphthalate decarboxylase